jgi:hypothetical protein
MKVVGTGAPRMLTIRLKPCEVGVFRDELHHRRAAVTEAAAAAHSRSVAPTTLAGDRDVEDHHDELFLIMTLLDELRTPVPPGQPRELVGPTWLLGPIIRGVAGEAVDRLQSAVERFREDRGTPTPDELRGALDCACACTATLIGLDYADNHGVT